MSADNIEKQKGRGSPGRPRSAEAHEAILQSTLTLLAELGYERLSIEAIAAHAGVGKRTIYRRWDSKEALVVEALAQIKRIPNIPDSGDVQQDILRWVEVFIDTAQSPLERQLLALIVSTLSHQPQLVERYWSQYATPTYQALSEILQRGQAQGTVQMNVELDAVIDILSGTLLYQVLVKPPTETVLEDFKKALGIILQGISRKKDDTK